MNLDFQNSLQKIAQERISHNKAQILRSIEFQRKGMAFLAEDEPERQNAALQRSFLLSEQQANLVQERYAGDDWESKARGAEAIQGRTVDFVPVSYLERGLLVARAAARVTSLYGEAIGTGFLASSRLLVTNHHVIPTKAHAANYLAQFNYEKDLEGLEKQVTAFRLDPNQFFFTDGVEGLDVTVVAIGALATGSAPIEQFGWCGLSDSGTKHAKGDYVTIVQHPAGRHKEVVLRENMIAGRHEVALHYVADTEPGSSGSPVFGPDWRVVALHHWAGPQAWAGDDDYAPIAINEGIRISRIVKKLREGSIWSQCASDRAAA